MGISDFLNILFGFAGVTVPVIASLAVYYLQRNNSKTVDKELKPIRDYQEAINQRIKEKAQEDVTDTIQTELNQLTQYYVINKNQARNSFYFSIFASVLGIGTLISGVWLFYLQHSPNIPLTALTGITGVLLQFIGGAFFVLYRKSLEQVNKFFSQLIITQDTALAIQLTKELVAADKKVELMEKIVLTLLARSSTVSNEAQAARIHNILDRSSQSPSAVPINANANNDDQKYDTRDLIPQNSQPKT